MSTIMSRVKTILALGYWVPYWAFADIGYRSIVTGWYFFHCDTQYDTDQDSSQHCPHDNHLDIFGAAVVSRGWQAEWGGIRVQAIQHHHTLQFWDFTWYSAVHISLQNQYIAMLHSIIGIGIGWVLVSLEASVVGYWILGALFGIILTLIMSAVLTDWCL